MRLQSNATMRLTRSELIGWPNVVYPHLIVGESDSPPVFCGFSRVEVRLKGPFTKRKAFENALREAETPPEVKPWVRRVVAGAEVAGAMEDASGNRWQGSFPAGAHGSGGWEAGNQARCPGLGRDSWDDGQIPVLPARMNGNGVSLNGNGDGLNGNGGGLNGVMPG